MNISGTPGTIQKQKTETTSQVKHEEKKMELEKLNSESNLLRLFS